MSGLLILVYSQILKQVYTVSMLYQTIFFKESFWVNVHIQGENADTSMLVVGTKPYR